MKTYQELTFIAEKRVDEMMENPSEAIKNDIATAMETLLDLLDMYPDKNMYPTKDTVDQEEKSRIVNKVAQYSGDLLDSALLQTNEYGVNQSRFLLYAYRRCRDWLQKNFIPADKN